MLDLNKKNSDFFNGQPGTEFTGGACPVAKVRASVLQDGHKNRHGHEAWWDVLYIGFQ